MKYRLILTALAAFALSGGVAACGDSVVQPQSPDGAQIRKMPVDGWERLPEEPCIDCEVPCPECGPTEPPQPYPAFAPPPRPFETADVPVIYGGFNWQTQSCNQIAHVSIAFSNDVYQGTTLYVGGVVVRNSYANVYFYDVNGNLVMTHATQRARDNCVIHHEPEAFSTWGLAPGYYYVYASYWTLMNYGYESTYGWPTAVTGRHIATIRIR